MTSKLLRLAAEEPVADPSPEAPVEEPAPEPVQAPVAPAPKRRGRGRLKPKTFVFAGRVAASDASAGTVEVRVRKGNSRGRRFRGEVVTFDVRDARIDAVEADGVDGLTAGDVLVGDVVIVQARLAQGTRHDGTAIAARRLVDLVDRDPVTEAPAPELPVVE